MDLTVIGHLSKDNILGPVEGAPPVVQYGGIMYSVATLAALAGPDDTIHPVFGVGQKDLEEVKELLRSLPHVDISGIFPVKGMTNDVTFIYGPPKAPRIECSSHIADPVLLSRIKPYLDTNGVLVNMVSGSDLTLETLDHVRMNTREARIPIHFDFHSLTLGIDPQARRFRRPLTDWRRWCFMLHSIQMSEEEAAGLSAERYDEPTLINQLMPLMVQALLITRSDRGATLITQDVHKRLTRHDIPGVSVNTQDATGCGDVFGAAYFSSVVSGASHLEAATKANAAAAAHAATPAAGKLVALVDHLRPTAARTP
ncbi:MAG: carbohydrate kinase family protein [Bacteroidetes bacterium]|jgi:sugar/nucleoside kinase (ribokinase family)|nr:carbohydrate kinase family protein [Bacteroidota bacterium]